MAAYGHWSKVVHYIGNRVPFRRQTLTFSPMMMPMCSSSSSLSYHYDSVTLDGNGDGDSKWAVLVSRGEPVKTHSTHPVLISMFFKVAAAFHFSSLCPDDNPRSTMIQDILRTWSNQSVHGWDEERERSGYGVSHIECAHEGTVKRYAHILILVHSDYHGLKGFVCYCSSISMMSPSQSEPPNKWMLLHEIVLSGGRGLRSNHCGMHDTDACIEVGGGDHVWVKGIQDRTDNQGSVQLPAMQSENTARWGEDRESHVMCHW